MQSDAALQQRLISMKPVELFGCLSELKYGTLKDFGWNTFRAPPQLSFRTKSNLVMDGSRQSAHHICQPTPSMESIVFNGNHRHLVSYSTLHVYFRKLSLYTCWQVLALSRFTRCSTPQHLQSDELVTKFFHPCNRHPVTKFPAFYGTRHFTTMFTRTRNRILLKSVESRPYAITFDCDPLCCYPLICVYTLRAKFPDTNSAYKCTPGVSNWRGVRVKQIIFKFKVGRTPF